MEKEFLKIILDIGFINENKAFRNYYEYDNYFILISNNNDVISFILSKREIKDSNNVSNVSVLATAEINYENRTTIVDTLHNFFPHYFRKSKIDKLL